MAVFPRAINYRDAKNQTSRTHMYIKGTDPASVSANFDPIAAAVVALSNATVTTNVGPATAPVAGAVAQYEDVEDKAVFTFQTASGSLHRYSVAACKSSIFQADGETIDYSNADVATFTAAVLAGAASRDGASLTASVGGTRDRVRQQRKFNVRTRNPALTGQGL